MKVHQSVYRYTCLLKCKYYGIGNVLLIFQRYTWTRKIITRKHVLAHGNLTRIRVRVSGSHGYTLPIPDRNTLSSRKFRQNCI